VSARTWRDHNQGKKYLGMSTRELQAASVAARSKEEKADTKALQAKSVAKQSEERKQEIKAKQAKSVAGRSEEEKENTKTKKATTEKDKYGEKGAWGSKSEADQAIIKAKEKKTKKMNYPGGLPLSTHQQQVFDDALAFKDLIRTPTAELHRLLLLVKERPYVRSLSIDGPEGIIWRCDFEQAHEQLARNNPTLLKMCARYAISVGGIAKPAWQFYLDHKVPLPLGYGLKNPNPDVFTFHRGGLVPLEKPDLAYTKELYLHFEKIVATDDTVDNMKQAIAQERARSRGRHPKMARAVSTTDMEQSARTDAAALAAVTKRGEPVCFDRKLDVLDDQRDDQPQPHCARPEVTYRFKEGQVRRAI
jgi:hypothetical protein